MLTRQFGFDAAARLGTVDFKNNDSYSIVACAKESHTQATIRNGKFEVKKIVDDPL